MHSKQPKILIKNQSESSLSNKELLTRIEKLERIVRILMNSNLYTKNKDYKNPVKEILSATSLQFILSPIRSKRILIKIMNSCFLILSMCLTIYLVVLNITEFLMYETTTSITIINDKEPQFPIVAFCQFGNSTLGNSLYGNITSFYLNDEELTTEWENYFEYFQDSSINRKCYRFNSGINMTNHSIPIKNSKRNGYIDGFYLKYESSLSLLFVSIYNQTQNLSTIYNKGYYISVGTENLFKVKKIYDTKLEYPYNGCLNDVSEFTKNKTIISYMKNKNTQYSQTECNRLYENLKYLEESNCNCSLKHLDDFPYKVCENNSEHKDCLKEFMSHFNNKDQKCSDYCPLECNTLNYEITINSFSSLSYSSNDSFIISVFYEDLKYTWINQKPKMQFIDLISNIGGSLGLFVGISFVSFLDLFEILIEIICIYFEK
jgi:hypothetical protein